MDLEGLAVLCAVEQEGSIGAAARALGLPRTTAWRRLNRLEQDLGCGLVERTQRSQRLTSAGREAAQRGRALLAQAEALREAAQARHRGDHGLLRVATPPGGAAELVLQALRFARAQWPQLRAVVYESPEPRDPIRDDFDLVASYVRPSDPDLYLTRLETMEWHLQAAPAWVEAHGLPQRVEDLARHDLLLHYLPSDPTDRLPLRAGGTLTCAPLLATSNPAVVLRGTQDGLGLGFFPWQLGGGQSGLVPILRDEIGRSRALYLLAGARQRESPRVQLAGQIMEWLRRVWLQEGGGPAGSRPEAPALE